MYLVYGVSCISVAFIFHSFTLLATRKRVQPFWVKDGLLMYLVMPAIVGIMSIGFVFCLLALAEFRPNLLESAGSVLIVAITAAFYVIFGFKKKVAALERGIGVVPGPTLAGGPAKSSSTSSFRKAA